MIYRPNNCILTGGCGAGKSATIDYLNYPPLKWRGFTIVSCELQ
jgi:predicted ATPase